MLTCTDLLLVKFVSLCRSHSYYEIHEDLIEHPLNSRFHNTEIRSRNNCIVEKRNET